MTDLPIFDILPALRHTLSECNELVLEAPPGAGKTTQVPLAALDMECLKGQRIVMLEPRRLAARAAAQRMAELLGERVGQTVGYRVRLESRIGPDTRIEVITEGILTRMLQEDPSLDGVGLLIFDEFHERSLDADLGLALALEGRRLLGDLRAAPLKIVVMSATLDGDRVAGLLGNAPVLRSEGRQFDVAVEYLASSQSGQQQGGDMIVSLVTSAVSRALIEHSGNILVFLPGQGEIMRCQRLLEEQGLAGIVICPLYGNLSLEQQRRAIAPPAAGQRKVVLATPIAESSITIEGISVVVDSGLQRGPVFDPRSGMSRLALQRISQASAAQRCGRAGRLQNGYCYRLWSEAQQRELLQYSHAEILQADLAGLALQLLKWGVPDPAHLSWLDPPPAGAFAQALSLLDKLGALVRQPGDEWRLSEHGRDMSELPVHPRLAHLLLSARDLGWTDLGCELAALLSERDGFSGQGSDLAARLAALRGDVPGGFSRGQLARLRQLRDRFRAGIKGGVADPLVPADDNSAPGVLLALAYPDRIARQRDEQAGRYQLSNGRAAVLRADDVQFGEPWLVVAELGGHQGRREESIWLSAPLAASAFDGPLARLCREETRADWDAQRGRFVAERRRMVGAVCVDTEALGGLDGEAKSRALIGLLRDKGLNLLKWTEESEQLRGRVNLLAALWPGEWPDFSDSGLLEGMEDWLAPYLTNINSLADLQCLDTQEMLLAVLPWTQRQSLDQLAPTYLSVPSGSRVRVDYGQSPPVLAVKLQEMFGCEHTPVIARGRQALMVHLLSPARRPVQITQDLAGFWRGSYQQVKKEMKGRYPKHPWPDDPLQAVATAKTKNALNK